ncbi:MAG: RNA polymerase sigma factor RpoD/SigA [Candidatus Wallbacteria bacterium]|nr:RNA polymerase sigma factor RpoD/SigA [Candidatus Wallbacteria bacterium]
MENKEIVFYLKEISRFSFLDKVEERQYLAKAKNGDKEARRILVCAHLPLVVNIAKNYLNHGIGLSDLIQEGNLALLQAIKKFDLKWKNRFNTYATYCVRQNILRAIYNQSRTIRLPVHLYEKFLKIRKFSEQFYQKYQTWPTDREISEKTGISFQRVERINGYFEKVLSLENYHAALEGDCTPEETAVNNSYQNELTSVINDALCDLSEKEREIIKSYFGIGSDQPKTLRELSGIYRLTKERIRQIKNFALQKLANSSLLSFYSSVE